MCHKHSKVKFHLINTPWPKKFQNFFRIKQKQIPIDYLLQTPLVFKLVKTCIVPGTHKLLNLVY